MSVDGLHLEFAKRAAPFNNWMDGKEGWLSWVGIERWLSRIVIKGVGIVEGMSIDVIG